MKLRHFSTALTFFYVLPKIQESDVSDKERAGEIVYINLTQNQIYPKRRGAVKAADKYFSSLSEH